MVDFETNNQGSGQKLDHDDQNEVLDQQQKTDAGQQQKELDRVSGFQPEQKDEEQQKEK